jgi:hypothetical protein
MTASLLVFLHFVEYSSDGKPNTTCLVNLVNRRQFCEACTDKLHHDIPKTFATEIFVLYPAPLERRKVFGRLVPLQPTQICIPKE